jgi:hypothetical protein
MLLVGAGSVACASERDATARAWVVDDRPRQGGPVTVVGLIAERGAPVAGAPMHARWRLSTDGTPRVIERACPAPGATALTGATGRANCTVTVAAPESTGENVAGGRIVAVDVTVSVVYAGRTYRAAARAWPRPPATPTTDSRWRVRTPPGPPAIE